jgi:adenylate cyclase class 2
MQTEIEVKFLNTDFESLRPKLKSAGAVCVQPMRLMKRAIIDDPKSSLKSKNAYIRIRYEGDRTTLTYKQFESLSIDGAKEIETTVGSFDDTVAIFEACGFKVVSLQESKRETWKLGGVEVVLDEWPWLNPYVEIEGESSEAIKNVAGKLGFDWGDAEFGDVMVAYRAQYPNLPEDGTVGNLEHVQFNTPVPEMFGVNSERN